ncbi:MAG: tetratricopeptide repeat protein, partial [Candidatus Aminicenantes bacterium]|nr:tetratricopeptide repeat protein [Candidatus Aminicenantes bacterium]
INIKIDSVEKQKIDKQKILFMNFDPIIEGDFYITVTFINKTTQEFFTYKEKIQVKEKTLTALVGFKLKSNAGGNFPPFSSDRFVVFPDPRSIFNQKDTLEGIIFTYQTPEIYLQNLKNKAQKVKIESVIKEGDIYKFQQPLVKVKDDNYMLTIKIPDGQAVTRKLHVLPFYINIERPFTMAKPEPAAAFTNYIFVQAQQYLNAGKLDRSIEYFNRIPRKYWNSTTLPLIARAYYKKKDYSRVMELLERDEVEKVYSTLLLLANSAIELKKYNRAVEYLEKLRKYGDTVKINQLLAATYLCLGKQDKAKIYYEKARKLREK